MDLVYVAVILLVGMQIFSQFGTTADNLTASSTVARAAAGNVTANTYGGFQTASVTPTVIGAVIVLGIVGALLMRN